MHSAYELCHWTPRQTIYTSKACLRSPPCLLIYPQLAGKPAWLQHEFKTWCPVLLLVKIAKGDKNYAHQINLYTASGLWLRSWEVTKKPQRNSQKNLFQTMMTMTQSATGSSPVWTTCLPSCSQPAVGCSQLNHMPPWVQAASCGLQSSAVDHNHRARS